MSVVEVRNWPRWVSLEDVVWEPVSERPPPVSITVFCFEPGCIGPKRL